MPPLEVFAKEMGGEDIFCPNAALVFLTLPERIDTLVRRVERAFVFHRSREKSPSSSPA